jgi:hypothetical protein
MRNTDHTTATTTATTGSSRANLTEAQAARPVQQPQLQLQVRQQRAPCFRRAQAALSSRQLALPLVSSHTTLARSRACVLALVVAAEVVTVTAVQCRVSLLLVLTEE